MEDEELNEEVMGDPDDVREVSDDLSNDDVDAGAQESAEEPAEGASCEADYAMQEQINVMQKQIEGLMASIRTIIESGATIVEGSNPMSDSEEDNEEPYLYLEDLDYTL